MNPYWQNIADFYAESREAIMAAPRNEWAIPLYSWEPFVTLTPIELWLWGDIREADAVFYPQYPVAGMFIDFANPVAKVGIECDGAAYHQDRGRDEERDERLGDLGWSIYRITGKACRTERTEEWDKESKAQEFVRMIVDYYGLRRNRKAVAAWSDEFLKHLHALAAH